VRGLTVNKIIGKYFLYYPTVILLGERVLDNYKLYNQTQWWPIDKLLTYQQDKLMGLLDHAIHHVPFYKNHFKDFDISKIREVNDIIILPSIDKNQLRLNYKELCSTQIPYFTSSKITGGSTGQAVSVIKTKDSLGKERAATWRAYNWAGIDIGDPQARFWGVPFALKGRMKYRIIDLIANRKRLSAFNFDDTSLQEYYNKLVKFRPVYYYGYVSMLETFARYIERKKLRIPFKLRCVITTSEVLTESTRKYLETVFGCKVFNEYGCGEVGSIAHECEQGSMHVMSENLIVEILNGNTPAKPGEIGEIVVTELNNYAMPLIRYRLGDCAEVAASNSCSCGRGLPVIKKIIGRAYDMIRNAEGKVFHGEYFMYIFEEIQKRSPLAVNQFQVIQTSKDGLCIKIVPGKDYSETMESAISEKIRTAMGQSINIKYELTDHIPRERSGKIRLIKAMNENAEGTLA
jgi:phenylacetate-CoA ligase